MISYTMTLAKKLNTDRITILFMIRKIRKIETTKRQTGRPPADLQALSQTRMQAQFSPEGNQAVPFRH
ncbi:hypothetical protein CWB98_19220 [Pseudoalteromonas rubra]|uniref:Uncharacterized protein n=1 Tax=Pseudoalteromonas rubra TaxID=43658 RepID=A0A5S3WVB4_9GAMM|nr:hypothetical protein CWB98_19220 [Pseudoalteromonas rubra]